MMDVLREFKPALLFLGKFLALYLVGNILYGLYVEYYENKPDPITVEVTRQTSALMNITVYDSTVEDVPASPKVALKQNGNAVLYVFEGCNGINVMIVFIAFMFAFSGPARKLSLFVFCGILIIHFFNLLRISLLFHLALNHHSQFYYYHKYFFTATLYVVVFCLWAVWVICFNEKRNINATA